MTTKTAGQSLAACRRQVQHTCPVCGNHFIALRTARFCSNRCRQAAKYAAKRKRKCSDLH